MEKISVVIPTLQKNTQLLENLLATLNQNIAVDEIIVIDNSLNGLNYKSEKLKVIIPETNLFVNPSWNLGVSIAKNERIALLNDDITVPEDFCNNIFNQMTPDMGAVGFDINFINITQEIKEAPAKTKIYLKQIKARNPHWGIAIFFYKSAYITIPDEMKIFFGDDWLVYQSKQQKRSVYSVNGQYIYHYGSLSCCNDSSKPFFKSDRKIYEKYTTKWWQNIISFTPLYNRYKITLFGIKIIISNKEWKKLKSSKGV